MQLKKVFTESETNRETFSVMESVPSKTRKVLLFGAKGAGKTTYLGNMAIAINEVAADTALFCSSVEIYAALFIRENEQFLEKLADVPVVIIDELNLLLDQDNGMQVIELLVAERDKRGLATVISYDGLQYQFEHAVDEKFRSGFTVCEIKVLEGDDLELHVRTVEDFYRCSSSPQISDDAVKTIIEICGNPYEIGRAVNYLMVGTELGTDVVLGPQDVAELLK